MSAIGFVKLKKQQKQTSIYAKNLHEGLKVKMLSFLTISTWCEIQNVRYLELLGLVLVTTSIGLTVFYSDDIVDVKLK